MKQVILFVFLIFAINFCFAFGDKERKAEIERLRKKYPQIKILVGLETNLISKRF